MITPHPGGRCREGGARKDPGKASPQKLEALKRTLQLYFERAKQVPTILEL